jgi:phage-related protein
MRELIWVGSSRDDLRQFPEAVRQVMGFALYEAQVGGKHGAAKPMKGFKGAGVIEIVDDHDGDTFRAVYTVRFADAIYVLHAFQKKAKRGAATPKREIDLIHDRLRVARRVHEARAGRKKGSGRDSH